MDVVLEIEIAVDHDSFSSGRHCSICFAIASSDHGLARSLVICRRRMIAMIAVVVMVSVSLTLVLKRVMDASRIMASEISMIAEIAAVRNMSVNSVAIILKRSLDRRVRRGFSGCDCVSREVVCGDGFMFYARLFSFRMSHSVVSAVMNMAMNCHFGQRG